MLNQTSYLLDSFQIPQISSMKHNISLKISKLNMSNRILSTQNLNCSYILHLHSMNRSDVSSTYMGQVLYKSKIFKTPQKNLPVLAGTWAFSYCLKSHKGTKHYKNTHNTLYTSYQHYTTVFYAIIVRCTLLKSFINRQNKHPTRALKVQLGLAKNDSCKSLGCFYYFRFRYCKFFRRCFCNCVILREVKTTNNAAKQ